MKRARTLLTYSLLGSVWLASCGGSNKKTATPYEEGEAGEAGETTQPRAGAPGAGAPSAGAGNRSGAGGAEAGGEAGQVSGAGAPSVPAEAGSGGDVSLGGQGGEGGEGGALICFNELGQAGAPTDGIDTGSAGAGSALHVSYSCQAILNTLSPRYDGLTGNISLDIGALGASAIAGGEFTARYSYLEGGEINHEECVDGAVSVSGNKLVLPVEADAASTQVWVSALALHDQCGNQAVYDTASPDTSDCFSLHFYNYGEGGWQVDCIEGNCYPACGAILPLPPPATDPGL